MKTSGTTGSFRRVVCAAIFLSACFSSFAFDLRDADSAFDAYNSNFYVVNNGFGFYKKTTSGGRADFWMQAEQIEMIIDAYQRTHSPAHLKLINESIAGFTNHFGADWTRNKYNDDIFWITIACARAYLVTTNSAYRDLAKYHFDAVFSRACDTNLGGGLWWTTDNTSKNACANGPAAIAACLLSEVCKDNSYLTKAKGIYEWERKTLFNPSTGAVADNIRRNGRIAPRAFTYNSGTFIGAANNLHNLTGEASYYNDALLAANFVKSNLCYGGNLPAYGSGDPGGFNGILVRWLARFANDNHLLPEFYPWMLSNANAAWKVRRADNLSWQNWNWPTPAGELNSWDCSDAVVILQVVPPTQPRF